VWIPRTLFDSLRDELVVERVKREAAEKTSAILEQHRTWLAQQVNRLEGERAILLQRTTGLSLPVPEVIAQRAATSVPLANVVGKPLADVVPGIDVGALMMGQAAFEDMGDDEAERQGVTSSIVAQLQ
jgi:hypothetical protein